MIKTTFYEYEFYERVIDSKVRGYVWVFLGVHLIEEQRGWTTFY